MNRLLLYVHFNKYNELSGHVLYQLEHMRPLFSRIVLISNSTLSQESAMELHELGISEILQRENKGYDFAAWRDGMKAVGFEKLGQYDSVTLMNDTCFGPLWDMNPIFTQFEERSDIDFWGMTNFRKTKYFKEHLQSYFLSFSQEVVKSVVFQSFWSTIKNFENVQDVIDNYETQVTTSLMEAGYRYDAVFNTLSEDAGDLVHPDFSYYRPIKIVEKKVPYLKIKSLKENEKRSVLLLALIEEKSNYPISYIKNYINRYVSPDSLIILDKKIVNLNNCDNITTSKKVIHIHVDDIQNLSVFLKNKNNGLFYMFTLSNHQDVSKVRMMLTSYSFENPYQIVVGPFENHFHALFLIYKELKNYEYIGHFHTSSLTNEGEYIDTAIRNKLLCLLDNCNLVTQYFYVNPDVGLIFSDVTKEQYLTEDIVPLSEREKLAISNEIVKEVYSSLRIFGGFMWLSVRHLEKLFLKRNLIKLGELYSKELLEILLYLLFWDEDIDYRIVSRDLSRYCWNMKLDLVNVSYPTDSSSIKKQFYNLYHSIIDVMKRKLNKK